MVYQGDRTRSTDNHFLGEFSISRIPPAPKGDAKVNVCFKIDANGILTVTGEILSTGMIKKLTITNTNERLSKEDIEKMVRDSKRVKFKDQEFTKRGVAYNALEDCIYNMKNKIKVFNVNNKRVQTA